METTLKGGTLIRKRERKAMRYPTLIKTPANRYGQTRHSTRNLMVKLNVNISNPQLRYDNKVGNLLVESMF